MQRELLELIGGSMHTPLTPSPKGTGDHSMRGRPRRRKPPVLWVVSARRVWRMLHCVNPSPAGIMRNPNGRWLRTLGPAHRSVCRADAPTYRRWQTLYRRGKGRTGRLEHAASHTGRKSGIAYTERGLSARQRSDRSTQGGPVMGTAERAVSQIDALPAWV